MKDLRGITVRNMSIDLINIHCITKTKQNKTKELSSCLVGVFFLTSRKVCQSASRLAPNSPQSTQWPSASAMRQEQQCRKGTDWWRERLNLHAKRPTRSWRQSHLSRMNAAKKTIKQTCTFFPPIRKNKKTNKTNTNYHHRNHVRSLPSPQYTSFESRGWFADTQLERMRTVASLVLLELPAHGRHPWCIYRS